MYLTVTFSMSYVIYYNTFFTIHVTQNVYMQIYIIMTIHIHANKIKCSRLNTHKIIVQFSINSVDNYKH